MKSVFLVCALALAACGKKEPDATASRASADLSADGGSPATLAASAAPSASAMPDTTAERLPTEHKADRKATMQITKSNYKAELDKVEKEIGPP